MPTGLLLALHSTSLVSSDNFGLGKMRLRALYLAKSAVVGVLGFAANFFATNERKIAFTNWMQTNRPDARTHVRRFGAMNEAADLALQMMADHPETSGFFVVWDTPANAVVTRLQSAGHKPSMATVDLGKDVARTTFPALLGRTIPAWIAMPSVSLARGNVADSFQIIWRKPAPRRYCAC